MQELFKIVETDNFGKDYPDEKELGLPAMSIYEANQVATLINDTLSGPTASRYWKVVPVDYELQGGFEP